MVARRIVTKALRVKGEGEFCRKGEDDAITITTHTHVHTHTCTHTNVFVLAHQLLRVGICKLRNLNYCNLGEHDMCMSCAGQTHFVDWCSVRE